MNNNDMDSAVCVQKCPNDELQEGDAVAILRKWIANHDPQLRGHGLSMLETIADMIERDYVSREANGDLRDEWHRVCGERDDLQRRLHESNREREQLRKQLGIAIDHAHDMIALVSVDTDEGAA